MKNRQIFSCRKGGREMNIQWNAEKYTSDFSFVYQYGSAVTELIEADPGSAVLDLGCGNGALSKTLKDKGYVVTGIDASADQLAIAREKYPDISFCQADAADFSLPEPVDVVFSNAVFHWIDKEKQPQMLKCVREGLKEGGQFVFEMGGYGNNQRIHKALAEAFARHGYGYTNPFYFPSVGEYASLLEREGFQVRYALLFDRPTELKGENGLADWIRMFVKRPFSVVSSGEEQNAIIEEAAEGLRGQLCQSGIWYADYVRLRMRAVKN